MVSRGSSFTLWPVDVQDECWAVSRSVMNEMNAYKSNRRNSSIYIASSCLQLHSLCLQYFTHRRRAQLCRHHVTCTKQSLSFQNTPDNLHKFECSLCARFHYMKLYHNGTALDIDSFSTHSDGTKGQPERKGEGNC